ncbi:MULTISPECIES: protein-disulfide reductase DsbD [unclassified Sphingomonas]|uniref:protein-disulfide reductase DsbD family protein n=1 Tax=unclassified Sphingomonas TaxID=196159 RepID=UPI001E4D87EB|nr:MULTISPECIES: protein-disulfide reductase DsbD domain-containing protein [unclassified Sphingomonas]
MRALYGAVMTLIALAMLGLVPNAARADSLPPAGGAPHLPMTLVADTNAPRAGQTMTLALDTRPEKGWHGYWRNPGDAGFAPSFDWTLPKGVTIDGAQWPVPETLVVAGLMNFVYATPYAPLFTVHVPAGLAVGTPLPIRVHVNYLVCTDTICVPEQQDVATSLKIGDGAPADGAAFDRWRAAIPKPLDAAATYQVDGGTVRIGIPLPATAKVEDAYFFAGTPGSLKYAAPQSVARDGDRLVIATQGTPTGRIEGVLRIGKGLGLSIRAAPGVVPAATGDGGGGDGAAWGAVLVAFAGALLGGLILNVMPCVFPILSLKALHLAKGGADERTARVDALGYTIGAVLTCVALGGAILALRAGGSAIGWAFQLQDPRVIVLLVALTLAIGLNLLGRFEVPTPQFATHGGAMGSIATGALAAFVATPCTGPFMGAALGAALVLPWPAALAVFGGLGLGLALPFLAIGFVPALRRMLPRPGMWMERMRRILAVPMLLTTAALLWLVWRQAGLAGLAAGLAAALLVTAVIVAGGRRQRRGQSFGAPLGLAAVALPALAAVALTGVGSVHAAARADAFSEAKLAELRRQGRPVFAYFTADWCLTCKVNERAAIDTDTARAGFARHKVAVLVGDWTDGDPVLGRFIQAHNRAGVPLYLYYAPGAAGPRVLPQVLTPGMLAELQ